MALLRRFIRLDQPVAVIDIEEPPAISVNELPAAEIKEPEIPTEEPAKTEPETTVEEKAEEPIPEKITEEPAAEATSEEPEAEEQIETHAAEEKTEEPTVEEEKEEPVTEEKKEEPAEEEPKKKRTRKSKKAESEKTTDEPETINVNSNMKKNQELRDALKPIVPDYQDSEFEEFKAQMEEDLLLTAFEPDADTATVRVILSNLGRCYDNATREHARVNTLLERLSNKMYGLIPRQIIANSNGSNEAERKQSGIRAPEVYTAPTGEKENLYALQAALEAEDIYLRSVLRKLDFKRSVLIGCLTSYKREAELIGD